MALITVADLKLLIEVPPDVVDASLQSFITTADLIVTESLSGKGLSVARLTEIEKYVAAHLAIQLTERGGLTSSRIQDAMEGYTNLSPMGRGKQSGLQLTRYGQQAIVLDTTGTLLAQSLGVLPAQFRVMSPTNTCND